MAPLKVAIWAEALVGPHTGTRTFLENLVRHFIRDHPDRIFVTLVLPGWVSNADLETQFPVGHWRMAQVSGSRWPTRLRWLAGLGSVTPEIGRHDIYFSGWQWPMGRQDQPFVATLHDLRMVDPRAQDQTIPFIRRRAWATVWDMSIRACIARAAAIATPSQFTLDHLAELGYHPRQPTVVIPHGVSQRRINLAAKNLGIDDVLTGVGAIAGSDYILSIGQHTPHKNFKRLIQAFALGLAQQNPKAQLIIVGAENCETPALRSEIGRLGLDGRIILAGAQPSKNLSVLLTNARVFAFPSLFEGFGLPVLEAFSAGVPVLTSATTSLREVAGLAALLCQPTDVTNIAEGLVRIWDDADLRARLVAAGFARSNEYLWEKSANQYLELFERAATTTRQVH